MLKWMAKFMSELMSESETITPGLDQALRSFANAMYGARGPRAWHQSALLAVAILIGPLVGCGQATERTSLLVITLDTTRRDHLPSYGYPRNTAPAFARLGREGVIFDQAFSQDSNTNPSHASMFTGLHPHTHGAFANGIPLPDGVTTLAQVLSQQGFATAAVVSGAPMRAAACGLDRGFDLYDDHFRGPRRDGANVVQSARHWLGQRGAEPWFLFVHLYDAHGPYRPRPEYARLFSPEPPPQPLQRIPRYQRRGATRDETDLEDYVARYDAKIRYADDQMAELLAAVDLEHTIVVVLADHGESLGERYQKLDHGAQVFDEQIRIPFVVRGGGLVPRRLDAPVETVDLMPTLLDLLDVSAPRGLRFEGRNLAPWLRGGEAPSPRPIYATARAVSSRHADRGYDLDPRRRIESVRSEGWKLIVYPGVVDDYLELYDLAADPGEQRNASGGEKERRARYLTLLENGLGGGERTTHDPEIPDELREDLRALGYLD